MDVCPVSNGMEKIEIIKHGLKKAKNYHGENRAVSR
jgi:hypothetical protein